MSGYKNWVETVEKPLLKKIARKRWAAEHPRTVRWGKLAAKEAGLLGMMMLITFTIVSIETGHLAAGLKVALVAGPIKGIAAGVYARLFH